MSTEQQANGNGNFEGWAILEIFGHQRYAGYVTTQAFGTASMFRLDVPALEARERTTKRPGYVEGAYTPAGSLVKEGPVQGYTKLFGVAAIYAMTPCSKEAALKAIEEIQPRPLMEVQIPTEEAKAIAAAGSIPESAPHNLEPNPLDDDEEGEDDNQNGDWEDIVEDRMFETPRRASE